ncbi:MAG: hypothetical protein PVG14_15760, partial [Anaerolineales bacterium]
MEVPTHGGVINVALHSKAVTDVHHGHVLALNLVEGLEGEAATLLFCRFLPVFKPLQGDAVHIVHYPQAIDLVGFYQSFDLRGHILRRALAEILSVDGVLAPFAAVRAAARHADAQGGVAIALPPEIQ